MTVGEDPGRRKPSESTLRYYARRSLGTAGADALVSTKYAVRRVARNSVGGGRKNAARLQKFRDSHLGERCVIIGNGPSIRDTPMHLLKDEVTFGLNRIYLAFPEIGFHTTYLAVVNQLVVEQCSEDFKALPMPIFSTWQNSGLLKGAADPVFLSQAKGPSFARDVSRGIWEGATVTYVAMQVAAYMGFKQLILIGVDHSFATKGTPHKVVTSEGRDPNHFNPGYFGTGFRWQLPDLETSEIAYRLARDECESRGVDIVDATVGGKLDVFRKERLESVLGK